LAQKNGKDRNLEYTNNVKSIQMESGAGVDINTDTKNRVKWRILVEGICSAAE
jgi:hypothetical protein